MSKPWFMQIALEAEPSPLAGVVSGILGKEKAINGSVKPAEEPVSTTTEKKPSVAPSLSDPAARSTSPQIVSH